MIGTNKTEWYCTDSDSLQYCNDLGDRRYEFVEVVCLDFTESNKESENGKYTVKSAYIDLNDYSLEDVEEAVSPYYGSLDELVYDNTYSDEERDELVAECIFEELTDGSATTYGIMTKEEAENFIEKYVTRE